MLIIWRSIISLPTWQIHCSLVKSDKNYSITSWERNYTSSSLLLNFCWQSKNMSILKNLLSEFWIPTTNARYLIHCEPVVPFLYKNVDILQIQICDTLEKLSCMHTCVYLFVFSIVSAKCMILIWMPVMKYNKYIGPYSWKQKTLVLPYSRNKSDK